MENLENIPKFTEYHLILKGNILMQTHYTIGTPTLTVPPHSHTASLRLHTGYKISQPGKLFCYFTLIRST